MQTRFAVDCRVISKGGEQLQRRSLRCGWEHLVFRPRRVSRKDARCDADGNRLFPRQNQHNCCKGARCDADGTSKKEDDARNDSRKDARCDADGNEDGNT
jgi:hypothetical protein